jgi:hypothetical protein
LPQKSRKPDELDSIPATMDDMNAIRISRDTLERWAHKPFFRKAVVGALVRVAIGQDKITREQIYRVVRIETIEPTTHAYMLGKEMVKAQLLCSHGISERRFRMNIVSNQPFTDKECNRYLAILNSEQQAVCSKRHVNDKLRDMEWANTYVMSNEEVEEMIQSRKKLAVHVPTNPDEIRVEMEMATVKGDVELVERLKEQLALVDDKQDDEVDQKREQQHYDNQIKKLHAARRHLDKVQQEKTASRTLFL